MATTHRVIAGDAIFRLSLNRPTCCSDAYSDNRWIPPAKTEIVIERKPRLTLDVISLYVTDNFVGIVHFTRFLLTMPKANKSSASAGTRKKHQKKSAGKDGEEGGPAAKNQPQKMQRGQKKLSKAQQRAMPKIKSFVPPPKPPAPPIPDPLDGQGLARTLPAELVVVLRRLGKKDDVTRRKGLEELREGWVAEIVKTGLGEDEEVERETKESALECAVPVWVSAAIRCAIYLMLDAQSCQLVAIAIPSELRPGGGAERRRSWFAVMG
jgi:hypothetical protein